MQEVKLLLAIIITLNVVCRNSRGIEYGPQLHEEEAAVLDSDTNSIPETNAKDDQPSDVASVSKFIKEFHRKFEEEPYLAVENKNSEEKDVTNIKTSQLEQSESSCQNLSLLESSNNDNTNSSSNETLSIKDGESKPSNASASLVNCNNERQNGVLSVEIMNSTRLLNLLSTDTNITTKTSKADCAVLLFYSRTCPFSCMAAPHFNALPRAFPAIKMAAVNVIAYQSFNTQYGIVGVPTVMLFHNGRPAAKFNDTEYTLEMFTRFITKYTDLPPEEKMFVRSADFGGPVPSVVARETDYWLALAWLVIATVGGMAIGKSRTWRALVEAIQNTWREAEAQHPHAD